MAVRDRILKDENSDISDHLRNHIHLTNCIHLKNHMHKNSPILADRLLMKDLMLLQRSRSLRDPSSSPRPWTPPSVIGMLSKQVEMDPTPREGRRSFVVERPRNGRRLSGSSLQVKSRVAPVEVASFINGVEAVCDLSSSKSGVRDGRRIKKEVSSRKSLKTDPFGVGSSQHKECNELGGDCVSAKSERKDKRIKQRTMQSQDVQVKTLSDQLNEIPMDSDGATSSRFTFGERGRHYQQDKSLDKAGKIVHGYCGGSNRVKRHKFRSARRKAAIALREIGAQKDMSVASNSLAYVSGDPIYHIERGREECVDQSATRDPRNGCGIPWNWSRIHHRSKTFLDMAGRSLSCGLSESRLRKGGQGLEGRDITDLPVALDQSSSPTKSDAEVLPLLIEESGSRGSNENAARVHDYSGELGIFANHLLKHDVDSDLASEARVGDRHKSKVYRHSRHQNLTQKWMPRTFRDLVGQNLVTQALSNAVLKRKVGLLYAFYGPHGTGKTSCARIFARALNCQSLEHSKPCGFCNSCLSHDKGKSRNIKEVGPVSNFDFDSIMDLLEDMIVLQLPSQYRVFIFDDCDTMSSDSWGAISNVIDRAPRRLVFILVSSSLDVLPHIILSRCQKFFFPKLKDADIICTLQWIATKEKFEVDKDALKLIASRSDGSLRDAEMTLEQLSLLGQRISVPLVQELVGLISDEKLVDLLDLALSADTVNTVKNLRETIETGVEPLALMSQLATIITDILAGSYDFTKERCSRKFFQHQSLSKRDMEKLRQALRALSEAEKQLRMSNDKLTWLTAALLQLAPDQQYMLPGSSADASFNHSPVVHNSVERSAVEHANMPNHGNFQPESSVDVRENERLKGRISLSADRSVVRGKRVPDLKEIEEVWMEVLEKIQSDSIRDLMYQEGELISISFGPAPTVQLTFHSQMTKSKVEKFRRHVLQAFESVLGPLVTIHIRCDSRRGLRAGIHRPLPLPTSGNDLSRTAANPEVKVTSGAVVGREEIEEISASPPREPNSSMHDNNAGVGEEPSSVKRSSMAPLPWKQSQSLVRSRVSLAHVIQQAEGHAQRNGWSKSKAVSIAEKLEQENLRLEPRSRSLLCWKASRVSRPRLSRLKIRVRRPQSLLKFVSCGKCLSTRSSR